MTGCIIGQTADMDRRYTQHLNGEVFSTYPYQPMKLIYIEEAKTRTEAMKRERELKTTSGRNWIRENFL